MDYLTFVAKLFEHLAWPIAVVVLAVLLREEIGKLLPLMKKFKAGPLEAEFGREMAVLKETTPAPDPSTPGIKSPYFDSVLQQLAEVHPRSAVLEAWVRLEDAARAALSRPSSKIAGPGYIPAAKLAEELVKDGRIDQSQVTLFHELRRLRNDVAHLVGLAPDAEAARSYIELAGQLQASLSKSS